MSLDPFFRRSELRMQTNHRLTTRQMPKRRLQSEPLRWEHLFTPARHEAVFFFFAGRFLLFRMTILTSFLVRMTILASCCN